MSRLRDVQTTHVPLARGLDTKSDERALHPPRLLKLENAVFDEVGGIQKRPGHSSLGVTTTAGTTIAAARMRGLASLEDELLLFAQSKAYSWSAKESAWIDRGRYDGWLVDQKTVAMSRTDQFAPDRAETGNVVVYAWEEATTGSTGVRYEVRDKTTGAVMNSSATPFVASAVRPRCRAVDGKLHVYYKDGANLKVDVIDPDDVYGTVGSATTLASDMSMTNTGSFDVDVVGTSAYIAYTWDDGGTLKVKCLIVNGAGTITTAAVDTTREALHVAISYNATTTKVALARVVSGANDTIKLDWLVAALTDDSNVNIDSGVTETAGSVAQVTVVSKASQTATVLWDNGAHPNNSVRICDYTSSAIAAPAEVLVYNSSLGSRAVHWTDGSATRTMVYVTHESAQQPCYVLLDTDYTAADQEVGIMGRLLYQEGRGSVVRVGTLPQIESLGSSQYACALTFRRRLANPDNQPYSEMGIRDVVLTHGDSRAYRGVQEGRTLYLPGAYLAQYDGKRVYESGFFLYPEGITAVEGAGGPTRSAGVIQFRVYWEWRNAAGEIERSTYSGNVSITTTGADKKVTLTVPTLPYTSKNRVYLAVYRTAVGGSAFYRISPLDPNHANFVENSVAAATVTFIDDSTLDIDDTDLLTKELDPLAAGELDPVSPQPTNILAGGQSRLFVRDPEDTSLIRFSKLRLTGDAVHFNDALTIQCPQEGGEITGIDVTDNAVLIFKERAVYVVTGQGPDNLGIPSYPQPQKVSDVGCTDARSIVRCPLGVIRKSKKGYYLLDNGYRDTYIGAPVEDYNSLTVSGAFHVPGKHRVHFVHTATGQLVYDYAVGEWCVWSGRSYGTSATTWGDTPVHIFASTAPYKFDTSLYTDGGASYALYALTGWLKMADLHGFYRLHAINLLGEFRAAHDLSVSLYYDYSGADISVSTDSFSWSPVVESTVGGPEQREMRPSVQKIQAIQVEISESGSTEALKLTGLSLAWLPLPGLARLKASAGSTLVK